MEYPVDYTDRDYDSIRQALIDRIPRYMPEWTSRSPNDFGIILLEMFAFVGDIINFYIDRVFNENFITTASLRSSVEDIVTMMGYVPSKRSPATGELTITRDSSYSGNIIVPVGAKFATVKENGAIDLIYEVVGAQGNPGADLVINNGTNTGIVDVVQGETVYDELVAVSDGHIGQYHPLYVQKVYPETVKITVFDGVTSYKWTRVDSLLNSSPGDFNFEVIRENDGTSWVKFGDGRNGRVPAIGSEIYATYITGEGSVGNVNANSIKSIVNPILGVGSVNNAAKMEGGTDDESTEVMRTIAPSSIKALTRAVTLPDYESLVLQIPGVYKASVHSNIPSLITLYVIPIGGGNAPTALKNEIKEWFSDKILMGVTVQVESVKTQDIYITADLNVHESYEQSAVKQEVENAIKRVFSLQNIDIGGTVSLSSIYNAINGISGVNYMVITQLSSAEDSALGNVVVSYDEIPVISSVVINATGGLT